MKDLTDIHGIFPLMKTPIDELLPRVEKHRERIVAEGFAGYVNLARGYVELCEVQLKCAAEYERMKSPDLHHFKIILDNYQEIQILHAALRSEWDRRTYVERAWLAAHGLGEFNRELGTLPSDDPSKPQTYDIGDMPNIAEIAGLTDEAEEVLLLLRCAAPIWAQDAIKQLEAPLKRLAREIRSEVAR